MRTLFLSFPPQTQRWGAPVPVTTPTPTTTTRTTTATAAAAARNRWGSTIPTTWQPRDAYPPLNPQRPGIMLGPELDTLMTTAIAAKANKPENPQDNPVAWLAYATARLRLHDAALAAAGLRRRMVRVPGDGDCLWHALAAAANNGTTAECLRASVILLMRLDPNWVIPTGLPLRASLGFGGDDDMPRYIEYVNTLSELRAEFGSEGITIAAHLLGQPITILVAHDLRVVGRGAGTLWRIEDTSQAGANPWVPGVNSYHLLLVHYDSHYDAAVLHDDVRRRVPRAFTHEALMRKVWAQFHDAAPALNPLYMTLPPAVHRVCRCEDVIIPLTDLSSLLRQEGNLAVPSLEVADRYFQLFRQLSVNSEGRHPDPLRILGPLLPYSLMFLPMVRVGSDVYNGVTPLSFRQVMLPWDVDPDRLVVVVPVVGRQEAEEPPPPGTAQPLQPRYEGISIFILHGRTMQVWNPRIPQGCRVQWPGVALMRRVWSNVLRVLRAEHAARLLGAVTYSRALPMDDIAVLHPPPAPPLTVNPALGPVLSTMSHYLQVAQLLLMGNLDPDARVDSADWHNVKMKIVVDLAAGRVLSPIAALWTWEIPASRASAQEWNISVSIRERNAVSAAVRAIRDAREGETRHPSLQTHAELLHHTPSGPLVAPPPPPPSLALRTDPPAASRGTPPPVPNSQLGDLELGEPVSPEPGFVPSFAPAPQPPSQHRARSRTVPPQPPPVQLNPSSVPASHLPIPSVDDPNRVCSC